MQIAFRPNTELNRILRGEYSQRYMIFVYVGVDENMEGCYCYLKLYSIQICSGRPNPNRSQIRVLTIIIQLRPDWNSNSVRYYHICFHPYI